MVSKKGKKIKIYGQGLILFLILWHIVAVILNHPALPEPWLVLRHLWYYRTQLVIHFLISIYRIITGVILALGVGIPVGILTGYSKKIGELLSPLIYLIYPIPKIAFLPLILLLLGLGDLAKIFLIAFILVFQIIVVTRDGVSDIPVEYYYSIRSLKANTWQVLIHVIIPAILPRLLTTLRLSIGTAIAVLFFAETFATNQGLGYYILDSWTMLNYEKMFTGILGLGIMGLILFTIVDLLERVLVKWK